MVLFYVLMILDHPQKQSKNISMYLPVAGVEKEIYVAALYPFDMLQKNTGKM